MKQSLKEFAQIIRDYMLMHFELQKSDIIIVLGSHDIRVADRGIELLKQGYAPCILFSGGLGRLTKKSVGFLGTTEAELFAKRAVEQGVLTKDIIIESKSTNTGENYNV